MEEAPNHTHDFDRAGKAHNMVSYPSVTRLSLPNNHNLATKWLQHAGQIRSARYREDRDVVLDLPWRDRPTTQMTMTSPGNRKIWYRVAARYGYTTRGRFEARSTARKSASRTHLAYLTYTLWRISETSFWRVFCRSFGRIMYTTFWNISGKNGKYREYSDVVLDLEHRHVRLLAYFRYKTFCVKMIRGTISTLFRRQTMRSGVGVTERTAIL